MPRWRVLNSLLLGIVLSLTPVAVLAEATCGGSSSSTSTTSTTSTASTGDTGGDEYVPGPEEDYTLEQPFGGTSSVENIGEYIQLVYQFALGIVGIIAVVLIMFGGLRWIAAAGNESAITEAKEIITSAVTGLTIALLSYTILAFINPQTLETDVAVFKIPKPLKCDFEPTLVSITSVTGLNASGQGCPNLATALQEVAIKMKTDSSNAASYCSKCTINVGSAYRSPEEQEPIYNCYVKCVDEGYMSSDGLTKCKTGTPSGCSYCAKAAAPCESPHNKGMAVDLYFSVGGTAGLMDIPSTYAGDATKNNGESGGNVNYSNCASTKNPTLCNSQKKLYDVMLSTGKFSNYSKEWWHFDLSSSIGCGDTTTCTEVTNSSGTKVANNTYCYTSQSDGTPLYRYATCTAGKSGCEAAGVYTTWYTLSGGSNCDSMEFSGSPLNTSLQIYGSKPTCRTSGSTTATGGSCPFVVVHTTNGEQVDNNILARSQDQLGNQVVHDLYQLRYQPTLTDRGTYRLSIQEWEHEKSHLDQMKLWYVPEEHNLAITPADEIVSYSTASSVTDCLLNNQTSCVNALVESDDMYISGQPGDTMEIQLDYTAATPLSLLLFAQGRDYQSGMPDAAIALAVKSIRVAVQADDKSWIELNTLHPREEWSPTELLDLSAVSLPQGSIRVRLTWTGQHDIDAIQLVTTEQVSDIISLPLLSARQSRFGHVLAQLWRDDDYMTTIQPGERIDLEFIVPSNVREQPGSLFLESRGYYYRWPTPNALAGQ